MIGNSIKKLAVVVAVLGASIAAYGESFDNDGMDAKKPKGRQEGLFSKAGPEVYKNMPSELKNIRLEKNFIEIVSDDYNMGDWQESPSKIIYHEGYYHVWIIDLPLGERKSRNGRLSTTRYLKSKDGVLWLDQGLLPLGERGSIDDADRLAPDVIKYQGKFYLFYEPFTSNVEKYGQRRRGITCLVADQPEGPWRYAVDGLLLTPSMDDPDAFDHVFVANPQIEFLKGKWFMYYKGQKAPGLPTENGVATADHLLGPYIKYKGNPLCTGHSANLIKYKNGLIYMNYGPHAKFHHSFYWTEDGFSFVEIKRFGVGEERHERMCWSSFFIPNNPLCGGDPALPDASAFWGISSRWAPKPYGQHNNDIIGATLQLAE